MQVCGLPGHVIRSAAWASRLAAQSPCNEAARRDALVRRWRQAMAKGLSGEDAAQAVGVPNSGPIFHENTPPTRLCSRRNSEEKSVGTIARVTRGRCKASRSACLAATASAIETAANLSENPGEAAQAGQGRLR